MLDPPEVTKADLGWSTNGFGLGYFDGAELTHFNLYGCPMSPKGISSLPEKVPGLRELNVDAKDQITDAFLGSDAMIEDFEGYNGRISDYNWEYVATKNILMPYYNDRTQQTLDTHPENDPDGFQFVKMGGKGNCFPQVTWQLRKVYVINGTPKDENHPLSARVAYQDAQTGTLGLVYIYDKKGDPWKWFPICKVHSDAKGGLERNKGTGVAIVLVLFLASWAGLALLLLNILRGRRWKLGLRLVSLLVYIVMFAVFGQLYWGSPGG